MKITDELIARSGKQFFARPTAAQMMLSENISEFESRVDAKPPADADKYYTRGFVKAELGEYISAIDDYNKAI